MSETHFYHLPEGGTEAFVDDILPIHIVSGPPISITGCEIYFDGQSVGKVKEGGDIDLVPPTKDCCGIAAPEVNITLPMNPTEEGKLMLRALVSGQNFRTFRKPDGTYEHIAEADDPGAEFPSEI